MYALVAYTIPLHHKYTRTHDCWRHVCAPAPPPLTFTHAATTACLSVSPRHSSLLLLQPPSLLHPHPPPTTSPPLPPQVDSGTWSAPDILPGSSPGPRAFHSAVALHGSSSMLLFGGHILTFDAEHNRKRRNFFNDMWLLDLVGGWLQHGASFVETLHGSTACS